MEHDNSYVERMVYNFNKNNFKNILNLGKLFTNVVINNKNRHKIELEKKTNINQEYVKDIFNYPENIENNGFMTVELINKISQEMDIEYIFKYEIPSIKMSNKVFIYVNKNISDDETFNIVEKIIDNLVFFIEYCLLIKVPVEEIPTFKIYYTSLLKSLHDDPSIPFKVDEINSGMTNNPYIMLWRKEELMRCVLHEFIHFYQLEFRFYTYPTQLKFDIYNMYRINALTSIRPNEAFCEAFANIFNIIIYLTRTKQNFIYNDFSNLLIKEIKFSISQIAKIFVFLEYQTANDFYLPSTTGFDLRQSKTDILCYFYFKTKLLLNLDKLISIINPSSNTKKSVFYIKYSPKISNFFNNFQKIITYKDKNFENLINKYMEKIKKLDDGHFIIEGLDNKNLRFTLLDFRDIGR